MSTSCPTCPASPAPGRRPGCLSPVCPQPDCQALKRTVDALPAPAAARIQFDRWCRRPATDFPREEPDA